MFLQRRPTNRKTAKRPKLYRMSRSLLDWGKLIGTVMVVGGLGWGIYQLVFVSNFCRLSQVEVVGSTPHLSHEAILSLAQIPYGENLLFVNVRQIEAHILRYRWVKEVRVKRSVPHSLYLQVEEYEPVALLAAQNGKSSDLYYMSREGVLFKKLSPTDDRNYPVITGFTKDHLRKYPHYFRGKVKEAFDFLTQAQNSNLDLVEVQYSLTEGVTAKVTFTAVPSTPSMELFFGRGEIQEKFEKWNGFLRMMKEKQQFYRSIDLHVVGKVFARH